MRGEPNHGNGRKDANLLYEMKYDGENKEWVFREAGAKRALKTAERKLDLLRDAQERAESKRAHLKIYHVDGSLEVENDYTKNSPDFFYNKG
jgi:hypothetical protein